MINLTYDIASAFHDPPGIPGLQGFPQPRYYPIYPDIIIPGTNSNEISGGGRQFDEFIPPRFDDELNVGRHNPYPSLGRPGRVHILIYYSV